MAPACRHAAGVGSKGLAQPSQDLSSRPRCQPHCPQPGASLPKTATGSWDNQPGGERIGGRPLAHSLQLLKQSPLLAFASENTHLPALAKRGPPRPHTGLCRRGTAAPLPGGHGGRARLSKATGAHTGWARARLGVSGRGGGLGARTSFHRCSGMALMSTGWRSVTLRNRASGTAMAHSTWIHLRGGGAACGGLHGPGAQARQGRGLDVAPTPPGHSGCRPSPPQQSCSSG